jgi:hypothetical protein
MSSFVTSLAAMFEPGGDEGPGIEQIEIPQIQRDYAHGRPDTTTKVIRENFLDVLCDAATGGEPVGLDFVYGEVDGGTLHPLDGQQRLTTLFLLHWYIASRTGQLSGDAMWTRFSYATRPSARMFCERLAKVALPATDGRPSSWLTDQPWYLYVWRHDPTVQGMLVVIDSIHARLGSADLDEAWRRLVNPSTPAITFDFLPIEDMGSAEDLYIKMNSRGRPLTDFENFKARLLQALDDSSRADELAHRLDGKWADLLWPRHGGDNAIDDEFINHISFMIELCEWRRGDFEARRQPLITRAASCFGTGQPGAESNLDLLFNAFDTWVGEDIDAFFDRHLSTNPAVDDAGEAKVVIFGGEAIPNLVDACIRGFGNEQRFGSQRKLLLYAVLLHRIHATPNFRGRLRVVRNLLAASEDELRPDAMAQIVVDVERVVLEGDLESVVRLNQAQRGDEIEKRSFLIEHPDLRPQIDVLEDHDLLRGSLVAFELDADRLADRRVVFEELFAHPEHVPLVTGALLALGQYQRKIGASIQFGAPLPSARWRDLLTGADRDKMAPTRTVLSALLDQLSGDGRALATRLQMIQDHWLQKRTEEQRFDWHYYLVRYPSMRTGKSGIYRSVDGTMGYALCMLQGEYMNGYYRDPYLQAVITEADGAASVVGGDKDGPWFIGPASNERWMELKSSGLRLRCVRSGFELRSPPEEQHLATFETLVVSRDDVEVLSDRYLLAVPQVDGDGEPVDTTDRIQVAAELLRALIAAGC